VELHKIEVRTADLDAKRHPESSGTRTPFRVWIGARTAVGFIRPAEGRHRDPVSGVDRTAKGQWSALRATTEAHTTLTWACAFVTTKAQAHPRQSCALTNAAGVPEPGPRHVRPGTASGTGTAGRTDTAGRAATASGTGTAGGTGTTDRTVGRRSDAFRDPDYRAEVRLVGSAVRQRGFEGAVRWLSDGSLGLGLWSRELRNQGLRLPACDLVEMRRAVIVDLHKNEMQGADLDAGGSQRLGITRKSVTKPQTVPSAAKPTKVG
jgi:hypothetical protein